MNPIQGGPPASYGPAPGANAMHLAPSQYLEVLDRLRGDFESAMNENKSYRGLREEYQRKVEDHIAELSAMENAVLDLDRKYTQMKEQYEHEIRRLKGQPDLPPSSDSMPAAAASAAARTAPGSSADPPMPSYQSPMPGAFSGGPGPSLVPQAPQPAKFGARMGAPGGPPVRHMSIPAVPPVGAPGMHPGGGKIPALTAAAPGGSRTPVGKLHPIGMVAQPADPKGAGPPRPGNPSGMMGAQPGPAPFGQPAMQQTAAAGNFSPAVAQASQQADDYVVYQGRNSANVGGVPMKVKLRHSYDHDSVVCCVRYSWDGMFLATGSNRNAQIFEAATGKPVSKFGKDEGTADMNDSNSPDSYVRAVCFSPDNNWLITGAEDHIVKVWDCRSRTVKHNLVGHDTDIYSVDASANGRFIISGSGDKRAKLWDLESGKLLSTLGEEFGPTDGITSVSVSPTSQHVAAASLDKIVRVWDVESGRMVRQFEGHNDSVYSVVFSPDGRMLLSGSLDKSLKLWDLGASHPSAQCRLSFTGHKDFVLSVMFSPNGRWLISGSKDRTVQFWDPRQSSMALQLQGHKNSVISIAHNPSTYELATGSGDCSSRTWSYTNGV